MDKLIRIAKDNEGVCAPLNAHQRVMPAEEDYNNQLGGMTCSVVTSQSLSPGSLSLPSGLMSQVAMVAGMGLRTGSPSPRPTRLRPLLSA